MSRSVHLFQMMKPDQDLLSMGLIGYKDDETLLSLRTKLETTGVFEFFQFWDGRVSSLVHPKLEGIIFVEEFDGRVIVFETTSTGIASQKDSSNTPTGASGNNGGSTSGSPVCPGTLHLPEITMGSPLGDDQIVLEAFESYAGKAIFQSRQMSRSAITVWKDQIDKLVLWGAKNDKSDHLWRVRTWDEGNNIHGVLECVECNSTLGKPQRSEDKMAIVNVFLNYRNKHLKAEKHNKLRLNDEEKSTREPFVIEGDVNREPCYSWIYRVRCVLCGNKFELVPAKKNLEHNLRQHLCSEKHRERVDVDASLQGGVRSGGKGRPRKSDPRDMKKQKCIESYFSCSGTTTSGDVSGGHGVTSRRLGGNRQETEGEG
ncbi:hypothetical protein R1sor_022285 [Riccia sorocarpa]|uniref:Uncharacterized protein n=1 Tax=Riccia sorocarpa TaxID=122646 RepID=A0ABD3GNN3_9MARC